MQGGPGRQRSCLLKFATVTVIWRLTSATRETVRVVTITLQEEAGVKSIYLFIYLFIDSYNVQGREQ